MAKTEAKQHSKQDISLGASNRWQHVLCQVDFNAATELKNVQSVRLFLLLAFQTNFTKKQTYEVSPVTC